MVSSNREFTPEAIVQITGRSREVILRQASRERSELAADIIRSSSWADLEKYGIKNERQLHAALENVGNETQKGLFKKILSGTWNVGKKVVNTALAPVRWYLKHPIRNTLIGAALLYFGAPYVFRAVGNAEFAAARPGLDWFRRYAGSMEPLSSTGLSTDGDLGTALGGSYGGGPDGL